MTTPREQRDRTQDQKQDRVEHQGVERDGRRPAAAAMAAGAALVALGLFVVTDGGPLLLGWVLFAVGLAPLLAGAVAQGVDWGLAQHGSRTDGS